MDAQNSKPEENQAVSEESSQDNVELEPFGEGKTALIVDDDPTTVELLTKIISSHQFETITADNGKTAWEFLKPGNMPDVIVSDFLMPEMNGFDFLKELKNNPETQALPVMIISARKNTEDSFLVAGVDAFFPKPLDTKNFLTTLKTLILREPQAAQEKSDEDAPKEEKKED